MKCPKCKKKINPGDSFCRSCGTKIEMPSPKAANKRPKNKMILIPVLAIVAILVGVLVAFISSRTSGEDETGGLTYDDVKLDPVDAKALLEEYGTIYREYSLDNANNVLSC